MLSPGQRLSGGVLTGLSGIFTELELELGLELEPQAATTTPSSSAINAPSTGCGRVLIYSSCG